MVYTVADTEPDSRRIQSHYCLPDPRDLEAGHFTLLDNHTVDAPVTSWDDRLSSQWHGLLLDLPREPRITSGIVGDMRSITALHERLAQKQRALRELAQYDRRSMPPHQQEAFDLAVENITAPDLFKSNGIATVARQFGGFPNAHFNHYAVAATLKQRIQSGQMERPESVIDAGCGTGFNGIAASIHAQPKMITFADIHQEALHHSRASYCLAHGIQDTDLQSIQSQFGQISLHNETAIQFLEGDVNHTMYGRKADLLLCAPMFIPRIVEIWPQAFEVFASVSTHIGADMIVGHSNLSDDKVEQAAERSGMRREVIHCTDAPLEFQYVGGREREKYLRPDGLPTDETLIYLEGKGLQTTDELDGSTSYKHQQMVSLLTPSSLQV